ncbi:hypothetical protein ACW9HQ_47375, partial [Nocardia gipuzkoensis]
MLRNLHAAEDMALPPDADGFLSPGGDEPSPDFWNLGLGDGTPMPPGGSAGGLGSGGANPP